MIDLRALRENPDVFRTGARAKGIACDIDRVLELDERRRKLMTDLEKLRAEQNRVAKETGPNIGKLTKQLQQASEAEKADIASRIEAAKAAPVELKAKIQGIEADIAQIEPDLNAALLEIPLPPDPDVPVGADDTENVELRRWAPDDWDWQGGFERSRGFRPKSHIELCDSLGLVNIERGVKLAGTRSYILTGAGMRLHQALLRYAFDIMVDRHGFTPMSVPVIVREEAMVGTGFFPGGREQAYHIEETARGAGHDLFLTGTGEVSLMGMYADEILDEADLPIRAVTQSTCFRREAGSAGRDTAGLYRIHQFDKVEQVVICQASDAESRAWHERMIGCAEEILQSLGLPYRLLQCCTGDLGMKNADMVDIECWMPGRGETGPHGAPTGAFGETHSASRLRDFQCRRLNTRSREGGQGGRGPTTFCYSLNNTVAASPRLMIPLLEIHQNEDGSVTIPEPLRPYMNGMNRIEP